MINLLYVHDGGASREYWELMLPRMTELFAGFNYKQIDLVEYLAYNQDEFDFIVYHTFPDETHPWKYRKELIVRTDKKFLKFTGIKILFDSRDATNDNGFPRFGVLFPRIKHCGGPEYSRKFDVIATVPGILIKPVESKSGREVLVHCAFNTEGYFHNIRADVMKILHESFQESTDFNRIRRGVYQDFLCNTYIAVSAPGYGDTSTTAYYAMNAGTCLFAHEAFNKLYIMPQVKLIDGEDYVSFNLDNMETKLRDLLSNLEKVQKIGESGRRKLIEGMNLDMSCWEFYGKLKEIG